MPGTTLVNDGSIFLVLAIWCACLPISFLCIPIPTDSLLEVSERVYYPYRHEPSFKCLKSTSMSQNPHQRRTLRRCHDLPAAPHPQPQWNGMEMKYCVEVFCASRMNAGGVRSDAAAGRRHHLLTGHIRIEHC